MLSRFNERRKVYQNRCCRAEKYRLAWRGVKLTVLVGVGGWQKGRFREEMGQVLCRGSIKEERCIYKCCSIKNACLEGCEADRIGMPSRLNIRGILCTNLCYRLKGQICLERCGAGRIRSSRRDVKKYISETRRAGMPQTRVLLSTGRDSRPSTGSQTFVKWVATSLR